MVTNNSSDYSPVQYNVQTGGPSGQLNQVAPSATTGVALVSSGSAAQPAFGIVTVPGGGTGLGSFSPYQLIAGGTSSTSILQSAPIGSAGQVLQSNGTGSLPSFVTPGLTLLANIVPSAGSVIFNLAPYTSTYYWFMIQTIAIFPTTNADQIYLQISQDGGSTYIATGYQSGLNYLPYNSATSTNYNSATQMIMGGAVHSSGSGNGLSATAYLGIPQNAPTLYGTAGYDDTSVNVYGSASFSSEYAAGGGATNFQITCPSGLITNGAVVVYGIGQ